MSSYITINTLKTNFVPERILSELTNDSYIDGVTTVDESVLNGIIAATSEAEIDPYLTDRYSLPLSGSHPVLEDVCGKIVLYRLYARRNQVSKSVQAEYDHSIKVLTMLARGQIVLSEETEPEESGIYVSNGSDKTKVFTSTLMEKYRG